MGFFKKLFGGGSKKPKEIKAPSVKTEAPKKELKPAVKANLISTSNQGVLEEPNTGRKRLLGN